MSTTLWANHGLGVANAGNKAMLGRIEWVTAPAPPVLFLDDCVVRDARLCQTKAAPTGDGVRNSLLRNARTPPHSLQHTSTHQVEDVVVVADSPLPLVVRASRGYSAGGDRVRWGRQRHRGRAEIVAWGGRPESPTTLLDRCALPAVVAAHRVGDSSHHHLRGCKGQARRPCGPRQRAGPPECPPVFRKGRAWPAVAAALRVGGGLDDRQSCWKRDVGWR